MFRYLIDQSSPASKKLDSAKTARRMSTNSDDVAIIACFATDEDSVFDNFSAATEMLREDFDNMAYTTDPKIMTALSCKPGDLRVSALFIRALDSNTVQIRTGSVCQSGTVLHFFGYTQYESV